AAGVLTACGQSTDNGSERANQPAAQPKKAAAYCFFKEDELKGWTAKRGKDGNIGVKGKAHVKDPRYKAVLNPATVSGTSAELTPTIGQNDTGYGAVDDTWDLSATIPNSAAVTTVTVTCGDKTIANLNVPAKG
ncbi:MAG: hypothetical protein JO317_03575, partial [Verrucomicrobiae bacterium]|nr:hypothetical protein [Verrucomicrobiae bacterium]